MRRERSQRVKHRGFLFQENKKIFVGLAVFCIVVLLLFNGRYLEIIRRQLQTSTTSTLILPIPFISTSTFTSTPTHSPTPTFSPALTFTPTPTLSSTPTPIPLVGYCLHVPVLMYHHIQPTSVAAQKKQTALSVDNGVFDQQMGYISSVGYTTITAKQLIDALKTHTAVPAKSIVITLDDGYKDAHDYAYPIFQKYHTVANLLIPTGLIEGADYLSWSQIDEMKNSGLIYFVNHTWSHYNVARGNHDKSVYEIQTGKQQIQDHTGQVVDTFGYPYGTFNSDAIKILQDTGHSGAFSTLPGTYQCDSFIMTLHRTRIGNGSLVSYGL